MQLNRYWRGSLFYYKNKLPSNISSSFVYRCNCERYAYEYVGSAIAWFIREARDERREARDKRQEARDEEQETRGKRQEVRNIGRNDRSDFTVASPQHSTVRFLMEKWGVNVDEVYFNFFLWLWTCSVEFSDIRVFVYL